MKFINWKTIWNYLHSTPPASISPAPCFVSDLEESEPLQPLYFVMHPDGTYSVADPQPRTTAIDLKALQTSTCLVAAEAEVKSLRFLLSQAPMIVAPASGTEASAVRAHFGYIHPKTFARWNMTNTCGAYSTVIASPTKWILTSLMPEGLVIYSPNPAPGLEKRLAEFKPVDRKRKPW